MNNRDRLVQHDASGEHQEATLCDMTAPEPTKPLNFFSGAFCLVYGLLMPTYLLLFSKDELGAVIYIAISIPIFLAWSVFFRCYHQENPV